MPASSFYSRRAILTAAVAAASAPIVARAATAQRLKAIAFDAFPIFDPRSIAVETRQYAGDKAGALFDAWSAKLFGYTWLNTAADQYAPFKTLADAALTFAATQVGVPLTPQQRADLVAAYDRLKPWPDVEPVLKRLKDAGIRLAMLSNLGEETLRGNLRRGGIEPYFEAVLSTDRVRRFKPAPQAYAMGPAELQLPTSAIGFAAFAGWDVAGAGWFGYRTAWINRAGAGPETVGPAPSVISPGLDGLLTLAGVT